MLLAGVYALALHLEDSQRKPEPTGDHNARHQYDTTVDYDGHTYRLKSNLTTILLMGIDNDTDSGLTVVNRDGGQADFLRLIVIDKTAKTISQLAIDRDTMTPITILGVLGNRSGSRTMQICLSHAFGNGREQSCELTREAVENLLFGMRIDYYMSMNLNGVALINDALGGVTVTLEDDFPDPAMKKGETITLQGRQAETFIRSRMSVGDGTNVGRMRRQQQFIAQATDLLVKQMKQDENYVGQMYDTLSPSMVNNISKSRLILEAYDAQDYARPSLFQIAGEHKISEDGFMQFFADETKLQETVLQIFYDQLN